MLSRTNKAYIVFGEVLGALLAACGIGWIIKWGSSTLLIFLLGRQSGDDPSNWDLIRLISIYSGIVGAALFVLWHLGWRRRIARHERRSL